MNGNSQKSNIPPPPSPAFGLRTMESDLRAIRESGGIIPGSQLIIPPSISKTELPLKPFHQLTIPAPVSLSKTKLSPLKTLLIITLILILIGGLGVLGYFVIYPLIFPPKEMPSSPLPSTSSTLTPPQEPEAASPITHQSLFKIMPQGGLKEIIIPDLSKENILIGLASVFKPGEAPGGLREVTLFYKNEQVDANQFIKFIFPELQPSALLAPIFENDFTLFVFQDKKGDWPGFVAKIADSKNEVLLRENLTKFEKSNNIKNLYLTDPGSIQEEFKDGKVDDIAVRYTIFTKPGVAFNYVLKNNFLIIATSYSAMQTVVDLLP
mgnify:CR=1 FL=1